ncbi:unnamed protein product, partial [Mesorhabditis belari]|uniref:Uncharacterized protein n=1 Tax=Mesorhabditis belari TaxID=2138241 RepID=A0AAF3F8A9_9BILA
MDFLNEDDTRSIASSKNTRLIGRGTNAGKCKINLMGSPLKLKPASQEGELNELVSAKNAQSELLAVQIAQLIDELEASSTSNGSQKIVQPRAGKRKHSPSHDNKHKRTRKNRVPETPDEKLKRLRRSCDDEEVIEGTPPGKMNRGRNGRVEQRGNLYL